MDKFFQKYPLTPDESDAIKMIHNKVDSAYEKHRHGKGDKYIAELASAYQMICDFFETKGIDIDSYS